MTSSEGELPEWSGERQRAYLTGFARLRAILWQRSFRLYELWKLGREPWFRALRRDMKRQFRGLDAFDNQRVQLQEDVFGETPVLTLVNLLERIRSLGIEPPPPFVDLGCGRGLTCLVSASLKLPAVGYEKEASWVEAARAVAQNLGLPATFYEGDFLTQDWPQGTFLIVATAFSEDLRAQIQSKLEGAEVPLVVTVDWTLHSDCYAALWEGLLPVDWGTARFQISQRS